MDCPVCKSAELHPNYDGKLRCPYCGEVFTKTKMKSCDKPEWEHCYYAVKIADEAGESTECHLPNNEVCSLEDEECQHEGEPINGRCPECGEDTLRGD